MFLKGYGDKNMASTSHNQADPKEQTRAQEGWSAFTKAMLWSGIATAVVVCIVVAILTS